MITVMGATGNTGRKITEQLLEMGEEVRALGRSPEKLAELEALGAETRAGDVRDAAFLAAAFEGADAVYTLTAFDPTLPDYHADQERRGEAIAAAIRESGVGHVVALSALGAELASGNGFIASLHRQEQRLRRLDDTSVMFLRPGAFFEGFYAALETIHGEGVVADSVAPDAAVSMVATRDVAAVAAEALRLRDWDGVVVRELLGPRDLTYAEATRIIGEAIGQPELRYVQLPPEELVAILTETAGFSPDFAGIFVEFNRALNASRLASLEGRNHHNTTPTRFEQFASRAGRGLRGRRLSGASGGRVARAAALPRAGLSPRQPLEPAAQLAFAIASSIAAPGFSTTLPWPGARRFGFSARSDRAVSSAVGLCQVASAGSGKRGFALAQVATPPKVE